METRLARAAAKSRPTGVREYQTVGGEVGLVARVRMPRASSWRRRVVSILAETPWRSARSSEKQRSPAARCQMTSAVQAPSKRRMHWRSGQSGGSGAAWDLRRLTMGLIGCGGLPIGNSILRGARIVSRARPSKAV